jgi:hypothetical protein
LDKATEEGVRGEKMGLELRVKLDSDKPWMVFEFDDLHQVIVGGGRGDTHPCLLEPFPIGGVKLVTVAMSLVDSIDSIARAACGSGPQYRLVASQPHRPTAS